MTNDTIYRQAAIDAVTAFLTLSSISKSIGNMMTIREVLEQLPSAQQKIIHCADCKHRHKYRFPPQYEERDYCEKHEKVVQTDGYCYWAER